MATRAATPRRQSARPVASPAPAPTRPDAPCRPRPGARAGERERHLLPRQGTPYVAGEAGTTRLTIPEPQSGNTATAKMKIDVGGTERQAASTRRTLAHRRLAVHRPQHSALSDQSAHKAIGSPAYLSATNPATVTEAALHGATGRVSIAPTDAARS